MVTIKVAGSLKGVVRVVSLDSTVGELRAECSRLLGGVSSAIQLFWLSTCIYTALICNA